jgi:hypothetical protein
MLAHKNMALVKIGWLWQTGKRVKKFQLTIAKPADQREIRRTTTLKRTTLHYAALNLRWNLKDFGGHQKVFKKV